MLSPLFKAGLLCTLLGTVQALAQTASCTFTFFQLPTTKFEHTFAEGINRYGTVVGIGCGQETPFECIHNQGMIRFSNGSLKTVLAPNSTDTMFNKRNASGVTVGESIGTSGHHHGIVYFNGTWRTVDFPASHSTALTGINRYGTMVGIYTDAAGLRHGFKLKDGKFTRITFPGAHETMPQSISDTGVVVGTYQTVNTQFIIHGFVLANGQYHQTDHPNGTTALSDINASGTIVGDNDGRPFILKNGVFSDVRVPNTNAASIAGINGFGTITGTAFFGLTSKGYIGRCQ
jgi:hypothetical protein